MTCLGQYVNDVNLSCINVTSHTTKEYNFAV